MSPLRVVRMAVIAAALPAVFHVSQQLTHLRSGETIPGIRYAIGTLSLVFLGSALAAEKTLGADDVLRRDILWGVGAGCALAAIIG